MTLIALTLALTAAAAPLPATAPGNALGREVSKAVFETCPRLIAGELSLGDAAAVRKLGFELVPPPRDQAALAGKMQIIARNMADGQIAIAAGEDGFCQVQFEGKSGAAALENVRAALLGPKYGFKVDPARQGTRNGVAGQTYRKVLKPGTVTYILLMTAPQPSGNPRLFVQTMVKEE